MDEELAYFCENVRSHKEFKFAHTNADLCSVRCGIKNHLKRYLLFTEMRIFCASLLANFFRQVGIEVFCGHHLVARVNVAEHDLLGVGHWVLVMENEERVGLHVELHCIVGESLQTEVKVDHTKLGDQRAICLSQLNG